MAALDAQQTAKWDKFLKRVGAIAALAATLLAGMAAGVGWYTDKIRDEALQQQNVTATEARLSNVENRAVNNNTAIADLKRVHRLEQVKDVRMEQMVEMVLLGQGQTPPLKTKAVKDADTEIAKILSE